MIPYTRTVNHFSNKNNRNTTFQALLFFLTLSLVARLTIFVRRRSGDQFLNIDTSAIVQLVIVGLTIFLIFIAPKFKLAWLNLSKTSGKSFLWYYFLCVVSALWSPLPEYSLYRAIEFISQLLAVFVAISYCSTFYDAEKKVLLLSFMVILLNIGMNLKIYNYSISMQTLHTNSYSISAAMVFCYCLGEIMEEGYVAKRGLVRYCIIAAVFLIVGTSSASYIAALCGICVIGILLSNRIVLVLVLIGAILIASMLSMNDVMLLLFPGKKEAVILTMSGRMHLWELYYQEILRNPIFGSGFATGARLASRYTTNTHNGLIAVLLGSGALGMAFIILGFYRLIKESLRNIRSRRIGCVGCAAALAVGIVNNMSFSLLGEQWTPPTLVFFSILSLSILFVSKPNIK